MGVGVKIRSSNSASRPRIGMSKEDSNTYKLVLQHGAVPIVEMLQAQDAEPCVKHVHKMDGARWKRK